LASSNELKLISWTLVAVVVLGVAAVLSLLQPPQGLQLVASRGATSRSIASISPTATRVEPNFSKSLTAELQTMDIKATCQPDESVQIAGSIRQIRMSGTTCQSKTKALTTVITNVSNGFVATVFHPSAKSFTTDYVTLAKGTNRILVREELKPGQFHEREITITRN
jgi:hypothetical protein